MTHVDRQQWATRCSVPAGGATDGGPTLPFDPDAGAAAWSNGSDGGAVPPAPAPSDIEVGLDRDWGFDRLTDTELQSGLTRDFQALSMTEESQADAESKDKELPPADQALQGGVDELKASHAQKEVQVETVQTEEQKPEEPMPQKEIAEQAVPEKATTEELPREERQKTEQPMQEEQQTEQPLQEEQQTEQPMQEEQQTEQPMQEEQKTEEHIPEKVQGEDPDPPAEDAKGEDLKPPEHAEPKASSCHDASAAEPPICNVEDAQEEPAQENDKVDLLIDDPPLVLRKRQLGQDASEEEGETETTGKRGKKSKAAKPIEVDDKELETENEPGDNTAKIGDQPEEMPKDKKKKKNAKKTDSKETELAPETRDSAEPGDAEQPKKKKKKERVTVVEEGIEEQEEASDKKKKRDQKCETQKVSEEENPKPKKKKNPVDAPRAEDVAVQEEAPKKRKNNKDNGVGEEVVEEVKKKKKAAKKVQTPEDVEEEVEEEEQEPKRKKKEKKDIPIKQEERKKKQTEDNTTVKAETKKKASYGTSGKGPTFAKRYCAQGGLQAARWQCIRDTFMEYIQCQVEKSFHLQDRSETISKLELSFLCRSDGGTSAPKTRTSSRQIAMRTCMWLRLT